MCESFVSQHPPKIVAPFLIIFFANSPKTLSVISSLFPSVMFGFFPISLSPAVLNLWTGKGSSTLHKFALNPKGIPNFLNSLEVFIGTSAGSIIATLLVLGYNSQEIIKVIW